MFKLWSQSNTEAENNLIPKLDIKKWKDLTEDDKNKIWLYFINQEYLIPSQITYNSIYLLNQKYKKNCYAINSLSHQCRDREKDCCKRISFDDFRSIFLKNEGYVVLELLSIYAFLLINRNNLEAAERSQNEKDKEAQLHWAFEKFEHFAECLNEIFEDFGIDVFLTREGFVPRQEDRIVKEIYDPVLQSISDGKWKDVSRELRDAFSEYSKHTPLSYSNCITNTYTALQAFFQILLKSETGKGELKDLILEAETQSLIPNDYFSKTIIKTLHSSLEYERKTKGNPHPKEEYATEKNARLVLNIVMVFLQHCIQK